MNTPDGWMMRALMAARDGYPAPNPHVGCAIVREGELVGIGHHAYAGGPHAEVVALAAAGSLAEGADAYVTLEPRNHTGRTGPCSEALIRAGIRRVWIAAPDPNPRATGGAARLCEAGLEVEFLGDVWAAASRWINRPFFSRLDRGRPFVVAKLAVTADGFIARPDGTSKWITGPEARAIGHSMRAELGAVVVGRGTVEADDPRLDARIEGVVNQPERFVIDSRRKVPENAQLFAFPKGYRLTVCAESAVDVAISSTEPYAILTALHERGHTGVMIEGGAKTIEGFLRAGLVDQLEVFRSDVTFGEGIPWLGPLSLAEFESKWRLRRQIQVGNDRWLTYVPEDSRIPDQELELFSR